MWVEIPAPSHAARWLARELLPIIEVAVVRDVVEFFAYRFCQSPEIGGRGRGERLYELDAAVGEGVIRPAVVSILGQDMNRIKLFENIDMEVVSPGEA